MPLHGAISLYEVLGWKVGQLSISYTVIGEVTDRGAFEYGNVTISMRH